MRNSTAYSLRTVTTSMPPIRPACTVVLLRDGPSGLETLLLRRDPDARFLGGFHVFAGGAIDPHDREARALALVADMNDAEASAVLGMSDGGAAFWFGAARETFEECGVLLATETSGAPLSATRWEAMLAGRAALNAGTLSFVDLLATHGLVVPAPALVYADHWVTPPDRPRRFDTRFFLARMPTGQAATHDGAEIVDAAWMRPVDALAAAKRGEIQFANATTATLADLATYASVDEALASARARVAIEAHRPCIAQGADGPRVFLRSDAAYHEIHWSDPAESTQTTYDMTPGRAKRLDAHVTRLIAPNRGVMTGPGTNSYLVGDRDLAIVDPGPLDERHVAALLESGAGRIRWILCTHTHRDHSPAAAALKAATGATLVGMPPPPGPRQDETFSPDRVVRDGETLRLGDLAFTAFHTPGHASNHVCFRLDATGMLFSGDHVMQGSTVVIAPPDGDMRDYLASLERLLDLDIAIIAPGHGYLIGAPHAEVRKLIEHRRWREARVLDAVARRGPARIETMLDDVYPGLAPALRGPAAGSLDAHLQKLVGEGRVRVADGRYATAN